MSTEVQVLPSASKVDAVIEAWMRTQDVNEISYEVGLKPAEVRELLKSREVGIQAVRRRATEACLFWAGPGFDSVMELIKEGKPHVRLQALRLFMEITKALPLGDENILPESREDMTMEEYLNELDGDS